MIITDIKKLKEVPPGEVVTLVLQFKVVRANLDCDYPCEGCAFELPFCNFCNSIDRPDKDEVKFIKI